MLKFFKINNEYTGLEIKLRHLSIQLECQVRLSSSETYLSLEVQLSALLDLQIIMFNKRTISDIDWELEETLSNLSGRRVIFINAPQKSKFIKNEITTTKYSLLRFIPFFLFEQFRKWANIFFLLIALLQQIPDVSPTGQYVTLLPLILILTLTAIKEIIEDIKRSQADDEINHRQVEVLRDDQWTMVQWKCVRVGDIVKVLKNNIFPADLVLLASSDPHGMSFIETVFLDGERNLKSRESPQGTKKLTTIGYLKGLSGIIVCESPHGHFYQFIGVLKETDKLPEQLGPDQLLLRGSILRNNEWIFGIVVYTGLETKIMKNVKKTPLKRSTVDKHTNFQMLILVSVLLVISVTCSVFSVLWHNKHAKTDVYIELENSRSNFCFILLTFLILFNNLIPISLQVTLEVVRFMQSIFINMDIEMYHRESDTPAKARTSNLNDELGQVKYIFSDKTGTLTRNVMKFKMCAIGNDLYTTEDTLMIQHLKQGHKNAKFIKELLILLCVCHSVIPEIMPDGSVLYHAASPDEKALLRGACKFGYVFESRTSNSIEINALGVKERYEILATLEFTSARKIMSVIVRDPQENIKLFCKGADSAINKRLNNDQKITSEVLLGRLEMFACKGFRTLCCAVVDLQEEEYAKWEKIYHNACVSLKHRQQKIDAAANLIERNLSLIGVTAIEDELQDGVPETIASLLHAGINVYVLTGDKLETAINIGYSCKLLTEEIELIIIKENGLEEVRELLLRHCDDHSANLRGQNDRALVIDGSSLNYALSFDLITYFLRLCICCKAVICCRLTPIQKAEVVQNIANYTKTVTLAIGDGANDVAMIQTANVGVGISGVEGLQAACASDYSIAQFRFLLRLLLVHGAWNYSRTCKLILYCFYKNICFYIINLWFAIYSGWSGQVLFEHWSLVLYNVLFTALPPLVVGLFDIPYTADKRMKHPNLYRSCGDMFNIKVFWYWMIKGIIHSAILFWLSLLACRHNILWVEGRDGGYLTLGYFVFTYAIVTVCLKAGLEAKSWTWLTFCAIWLSIVLLFLFISIYSMFWPTIPVGSIMLGMSNMLFSTPVYWLGLLVVPVTVLLPEFTMKVIYNTIYV